MSDYLGWTERRPTGHRREEHEYIGKGPVTSSYETYVRNIFHPSNRLKKDPVQSKADNGISASRMLRMEQSLGRAAVDDRYDTEHMFMKTPLEAAYADLGLKYQEVSKTRDGPKPSSALYKQFPVYAPKQSSEYYAVKNTPYEKRDEIYGDGGYRGAYSSYKDKADEEYEKNNKTTTYDYQSFERDDNSKFAYDGFMYSPVSQHLYRDNNVRQQDSRILGSNFVQVTTRPRDRFLDKIDQTLAEVRAMPRHN